MVGGISTATAYGLSVPNDVSLSPSLQSVDYVRKRAACENDISRALQAATFDWAGAKVKRDAYVKRLNGIYEKNWKGAGIDVIEGYDTQISPSSLASPTCEGPRSS